MQYGTMLECKLDKKKKAKGDPPKKKSNLLTAAFKREMEKSIYHQKKSHHRVKLTKNPISVQSYLVHPRRLQRHPNRNQFLVASKRTLALPQSKEWS